MPGPDIAGPEIPTERFDFPPEHLITTVRRGPRALFDSWQVNRLHKRGKSDRCFWCQSGCIDFREGLLGLYACLFFVHVSHSAELLC